MAWWVWGIVGLIALGAELATPAGFYLAGFGVGALVVAALVGIGLGGPLWLELVLFAGISVVAVLGSRAAFGGGGREEGRRDLADLVGDEVVVVEDLAPGGIGQVEHRGTVWRARNAGASTLPCGARVRVESVEGVTLVLRG